MNQKSYNYFMKADTEPYIDEWIAVVDNKVVSHGKNAKKVFQEAKHKFPGKSPLITKVPGKETMIL
ncbi:MAG: hypothetical protein KKB03_01645 [Nanoarchaeota archaeon]|nr:hypothetical protein [Nanoarchaeota archaeon]MBU2519929.1 hypothetical protein [Nanoarchaeota archaeon]